MEYINNDEIRLPLIGLGTFSLHGERLSKVVYASIQLGYNFFDTATKYGNEEEIGIAIKDVTDILLQSKVHDRQLIGTKRYLWLNKKSVKKSHMLSSKRLQSNPDIYLLHSTFKGYEQHFKELVSLRENRKTKAIGICNISLEQLKSLVKKTGRKPDIVQVEIHPYHSNKELIDYCKGQEILVEARSPLAHGDVMEEWKSNAVLQNISSKYGKSIPQVILRWITQQNVIAIVRTKNVDHLKENINIFDFTLTEDELNKIDSLNKNQSFGFISSKR